MKVEQSGQLCLILHSILFGRRAVLNGIIETMEETEYVNNGFLSMLDVLSVYCIR